MRANGPSLKVLERTYVTDRVRKSKLTAREAREEFKRGIAEVERAAAARVFTEDELGTIAWAINHLMRAHGYDAIRSQDGTRVGLSELFDKVMSRAAEMREGKSE